MSKRGKPVLLALLAALVLLAPPRAARADIRVWEEHPNDVWQHRYFDVTGVLQPGFIYRQNDPNSPLSDDNFIVQRARLGFRAQLHRWVTVRLELETTPAPALLDAYIDFKPHAAFTLRMGQFQIGFLRTFLNNESNLGFIDRPLYVPAGQERPALRYLSPRDIGVMATGLVGDVSSDAHSPVFEYWAGVFLGRGANQIRNDDDAFLYAARAQLHVRGVPEGRDSESDLARNASPRVSVGAGVYTNCDDRGQWNRGFTADAELRWQGLFVMGAFVWFKNGPSTGLGDTLGYGIGCGASSTMTPAHLANGAHLQAQYVLPVAAFPLRGQALEVLARADYVDPNSPSVGFLGGGAGDAGYSPPPQYSDGDNPPSRWRLTFGLNWFPTSTQSLRLSVNYQLNRESEHVVATGVEIAAIKNDILWIQLTAGL